MRFFGPPNIQKMKAKNNIAGLVKALSYKGDANVCLEAAKALGQIGDAKAVSPLIVTSLDHQHETIRVEAIRALGQIRDGQAVVALIAQLENTWPSSTIKNAAVDALTMIGEPAIKPIASLLTNKNHGHIARSLGISALGKIGNDHAVRLLVSVLQRGRQGDKIAATDALEKIGWEPEKSVAGATFCICRRDWDRCIEIGMGSLAVKPLINAIKGSDATVRNDAVNALVKIGEPSVEPLAATLKNKDPHIRRMAAEALGNIGRKSAVEPLIARLDDMDGAVIVAAFDALNQIGWEYRIDVERVNSCIANGDLDKLKEYDYKQIRPLLIKSLRSTINWQIRGRVAASLNQHGMKVSDPCLRKTIQELKRMETTPDEMENVLVPGERNDYVEERVKKSNADIRSRAHEIIKEFKDWLDVYAI